MTRFRLSTLSASLLSLIIGSAFGAGVTSAALKGSALFPDVVSGSFYDDAVGEMYSAGIIKGYDNGKFGPDDTVTRGQVAVLMKRLRDDLLGKDISDSTSSRSSSSKSSSSSSLSSSQQTVPDEGAVRFTTNAYSVDEDDGTATISVIRTGGNEGVTTVEYATSDGTAVNDTDYEVISGTVSFADGETSQTFTVKILNDSTSEADETVTLTLSSPTGGMIMGSPSTATLTIKNDDGTTSGGGSSSSVPTAGIFSFSAAEYQIGENSTTINVTVLRTGSSQGSAGVNYATSDGTAKNGTDYDTSLGTLTFAAGETSKTFSVAISDDSTIDGSKSLTLTLSTPTNGAVINGPTSSLMIVDNETIAFGSGTLKFSKEDYDAYETDGSTVITVKRTGGANGIATVKYEVTSGTASAGSDFTATNGTLTFAHGEASKTFTITIANDTSSEPEETVNLRILDATEAVIGTPATATLRIN